MKNDAAAQHAVGHIEASAEHAASTQDGDLSTTIASMLAAVNEPRQMIGVALSFLSKTLRAGRADLAFGLPTAKELPIAVSLRGTFLNPSTQDAYLPNRHPVFQRVWRSPQPLTGVDCQSISVQATCFRDDLSDAGLHNPLAQRLLYRNDPLGIVCLDTQVPGRYWKNEDKIFLSDFSKNYLAPLISLSRQLDTKRCNEKPSPAELKAIRLSAQGFSYKRIAQALEKSERTVESQFRSARARTGARNQEELIKLCEAWL